MKRIPFLRVTGLYLSLAAFAQPQEAPRGVIPVETRHGGGHVQKLAVIVGINNYTDDSGLRKLNYARQDAEVIARRFKLLGYEVALLDDSKATRREVRKALKDAADTATAPDSTIVFFFAGHGAQADGVQYLIPQDGDGTDLEETSLSMKSIEDLLVKSPAGRKILFIDACRNNPEAGSTRGGGTLERLAQISAAKGLLLLNSTAPDRVSYEDDTFQHGVFTKFLLDGLSGEAADPQGLITFSGLAEFVSGHVSKYGFENHKPQVPYYAGESSGDLLIAQFAAPRGDQESKPLDDPAWLAWLGAVMTAPVSTDCEIRADKTAHHVGERLNLQVRTTADVYWAVFDLDSTGALVKLAPEDGPAATLLKRGEWNPIVDVEAAYPLGTDQVTMVCSTEPLDPRNTDRRKLSVSRLMLQTVGR